MNDYNKIAEENLLSMKRKEEKTNKKLLNLEIVIGVSVTIAFLVLCFAAIFAVDNIAWKYAMILVGLLLFVVGVFFAVKIEADVGYYYCAKCNYHFVPTFSQCLFAMRWGRTRFMKCPKCDKWCWCKKVLTQEET